jgi:hypothetical protein
LCEILSVRTGEAAIIVVCFLFSRIHCLNFLIIVVITDDLLFIVIDYYVSLYNYFIRIIEHICNALFFFFPSFGPGYLLV